MSLRLQFTNAIEWHRLGFGNRTTPFPAHATFLGRKAGRVLAAQIEQDARRRDLGTADGILRHHGIFILHLDGQVVRLKQRPGDRTVPPQSIKSFWTRPISVIW